MLTDKQNNQLKYELKRRFTLNVDRVLNDSIDNTIEKGVALGDIVTIQLIIQTRILEKTKEGRIQLARAKEV